MGISSYSPVNTIYQLLPPASHTHTIRTPFACIPPLSTCLPHTHTNCTLSACNPPPPSPSPLISLHLPYLLPTRSAHHPPLIPFSHRFTFLYSFISSSSFYSFSFICLFTYSFIYLFHLFTFHLSIYFIYYFHPPLFTYSLTSSSSFISSSFNSLFPIGFLPFTSH